MSNLSQGFCSITVTIFFFFLTVTIFSRFPAKFGTLKNTKLMLLTLMSGSRGHTSYVVRDVPSIPIAQRISCIECVDYLIILSAERV